MKLREQFAEKMLDEKLTHLPITESIELEKSDESLNDSKYHWVINLEELDEYEDYSQTETEFYLNQLLKEYDSLEDVPSYLLAVGHHYNHFSEFTYPVCCAPTYIELL